MTEREARQQCKFVDRHLDVWYCLTHKCVAPGGRCNGHPMIEREARLHAHGLTYGELLQLTGGHGTSAVYTRILDAMSPAPCARCAAVEDAQASMQQRMDTLEEEVLHVESLLRSEEAESGRLLARETALLARASALQNQLNRAGDRIAALTREADTPTQRDESSETLRERIREMEDEVRDLRRVEMLLHEATTTCEAERRGRSPEVKKFLTWMNGMAMGYGKGYLATMEYIESLEALAALARPAPGGTT